ncbi:MAG: undecaprenyl/decaprenyl-phosphate alpha-N-acetylglucosaminyl 1-phosphate transferase [Candidatus Hydrogenedentes bacterium]|nr:undecaprenyl/decaprenyl-phosphate alpha-N-acetylglucosaminyl 1-phosphate transferase [Candidatus Hydrogenedentota bacterium]
MLPSHYLIFMYLLGLSFVISLALTAVMRRLAFRLNILDHPAGRKSHAQPTPLLGGAAIFLTFHLVIIAHLLFLALARPYGPDWLDANLFSVMGEDGGLKLSGILIAGTLIFLLGIIDDLHVLSPWMKLAGQIGVALILVLFGIRIQAFIFTDPVSSSLITVFWIVLMMNSMNLLDNMDGLCGGVSIIAAATFFLCVQPYSIYIVIRLLLVIFAGAVGGFLFFNLPPARIFMGDSGAMFSGYFLATIATIGTFHLEGTGSRISVVAPLMALSVPLFDTLSVMYIRWRNGDSIMLGDKRHFSHRLVEVGMRPSMAVYFIYMVAALVGLNGALLPKLDLAGTVITLVQTLGIFLLIVLLMNAGKRNGAS